MRGLLNEIKAIIDEAGGLGAIAVGCAAIVGVMYIACSVMGTLMAVLGV